MIPQIVWIGQQKCNCACHEKSSYYKHEKECCVVCNYCKFKIKTEYYSLHRMCHETHEKLLEEK
jgi:hypothetical protein